jgi:diguanylate cyclase (GGDEF)-like protein
VHRLLPELVDRLTKFASSALGAKSVLVALRQPGETEPTTWHCGEPPPPALVKRIVGVRGAVIVEDARRTIDGWVGAYAAAPVLVEGEQVGGVCVSERDSRPWSAQDLDVLRELAQLVAHCYGQRKLIDGLLELSHVDELTGLYNRRGFNNLGEQELRLATRERRPVALFFIDLNGMKQINDDLGHEEGDRALADAAGILRSTFRDSDVVARLGGDEFAVLAHDCSTRGSEAVRDRLDAAIADFNAAGRRGYKLSMSVGAVTRLPEDSKPLAELVREADARMYREKRRTRRGVSAALASSYVWATSPLEGDAGAETA